jgi:glycosyltransferase involved in cell wall biosynthesis
MFIMIDRQPPERIPELLAACDAAFISFMPDPLFEKTIPAKLQSYMACGMPIIAAANGETKRIIDESNCGICVELGNAELLGNAIITMSDQSNNQMRNMSRTYFTKHFEKEKIMKYLDGYFKG